MKNLFYLAVAIVALSSCKKTNPTPTVAPTPTPPVVTPAPKPTVLTVDIKRVAGTYNDIILNYTLNKTSDYLISNGNKVVLTYVAGDSVHIDLTSQVSFSCTSKTVPLKSKLEDAFTGLYTFQDDEFEIYVTLNSTSTLRAGSLKFKGHLVGDTYQSGQFMAN